MALGGEFLAAARCECVDPSASALRDLDGARDHAGPLESVQRRVDRALGKIELPAAAVAQRGDDRVSVGGSVTQDAHQQQVKAFGYVCTCHT